VTASFGHISLTRRRVFQKISTLILGSNSHGIPAALRAWHKACPNSAVWCRSSWGVPSDRLNAKGGQQPRSGSLS
jgi:hypothetical protein